MALKPSYQNKPEHSQARGQIFSSVPCCDTTEINLTRRVGSNTRVVANTGVRAPKIGGLTPSKGT